MASSKFLTAFCCVFISVCVYIVMYPKPRIRQTNGDYFPPEGEKSVTTAPSTTQIIWARLNKGTGKFAFHRQPLSGPIQDVRAFAFDTVQNTYIFSGGDPNQLISFNKESHTFDVVADDVVHVSAMDTDYENNVLYLIDSGKKTMEIMDLKTYERKVVEENVTYQDLGLIYGAGAVPKRPSNSPYHQREKMLGKVFTKTEYFSEQTRRSVFLGRNSQTDTMIFASWDGKKVTIEKGHDGYVGNLRGLEIEGDWVKDLIYVSNRNGIAVVAI